MLITLVPLFDDNMSVKAYSLFLQKKNLLLEPQYMSASQQFNEVNIAGFEVIDSLGIDTLAKDTEIFIPVTNVSLFADIDSQCNAPHDRIVLFLDNTVKPDEMYIKRLNELKASGYKLAIRKLNVSDFEPYRQILLLMDYVFLNHQKIVISKAKIYFSMVYPNVKLIAGGLQSQEVFDELKSDGGYQLFEGDFYRMPVTKGDTDVSPLKINYIALLKLVNSEDFELTEAADIIGRDTALIIALLKMVNKMSNTSSEITSIRHAAAMLGQKELKKWITTAITQQLCSDKPSEITRVSLLRAKFCENLAGTFELGIQAPELFLMGLFSVVDLILNKPMDEALDMLKVSKNISNALVSNSGPYSKVLDFVKHYENADWQEISRLMIVDNISMKTVYAAYIDSLEWYRDLFAGLE